MLSWGVAIKALVREAHEGGALVPGPPDPLMAKALVLDGLEVPEARHPEARAGRAKLHDDTVRHVPREQARVP